MKHTEKLSDVIEIIGGGTPKRNEPSYWNGNIPWLSVADFNNDFRFVSDTAEKITELGLKNSSTKLLKKGQIIISARGTVGCLAQLAKDMAFNQSCYGLSGKSGVIDNNFLYYFLKNNINELKQKTHGSVFDTITRATFDQIYISYPNILEQKKISDILGNLDQKIELNTQTNQTLEQIAQGIFKHWFIDFAPVHAKANALARGETTEQAELATMACLSGKTVEKITALKTQDPTAYHQLQQTAAAFPSEFVETEMGEVPRGWEVKPINEICRVVYGKGLPKNQLRASGYPVYGANGIIGYYDQYLYENRQVLVGCRGTVGQVYVSQPYSYITSNSLVIEYEKTTINLYFLELYLKSLDLSIFASGSVQPQITIQNLLKLKILIPGKEILDSFATLVEPIYQLTYKNDDEKKTLSETRDLLLPKLLNGEIEL
ncbi:restriction endonuclease subunit S [Avibacterium avium]|uniref:restriction endonuclease subunit S n=1 Tax=Avibacterium avium TaxID=751 RepID=UPI003BF78258